MQTTHAINLSSVSKRFGAVSAVDDVSLSLRCGEFFTLLGPSGCGKSTLLRMIAGFESPTDGEVFVGGIPMKSMPANKRPINMVFQNYAVFPHLNVNDNIAFGLRRSGLSQTQLATRVNESIETVGLSGFSQRRVTSLSGGQRQRVALARALIMEPQVLLLDEPLSALDKQLREQMQIELRRLQRSVGITFLLVTHDQNEAMAISDRCGVMFDGRLTQVDTPARLYDHPLNQRVAEFIGKFNFLEGVIKGTDDEFNHVFVEGFGIAHVPKNGHNKVLGESVMLGVRPERITLSHDKSGEMEMSCWGIVRDIIFYGESLHYYIEIEGRSQLIIASSSNYFTQRFSEGERVCAGVSGNSLNLLDP